MSTSGSQSASRSVHETHAEGLGYLMGHGSLNYALEQLAADLQSHGIDYAVTGAVALFAHGYKGKTG